MQKVIINSFCHIVIKPFEQSCMLNMIQQEWSDDPLF